MKTAQMKQRCKDDFKFLSVGVLYGWRMDMNVYAEHYKRVVAGITETKLSRDIVHGVLWEISANDLAVIEEKEAGGYVHRQLSIRRQGQEDVLAYVFVPDETRLEIPDNAELGEDYLSVLLEGANDHHIGEDVRKAIENARKRFTSKKLV